MIKRNIDTIVLHCSDSPQGRGDTVKQIDQWHRERGFDECGYHYVVLEDGSIQIGRDLNTVGAHARGHNSKSIGICMMGRDSFTQDQLKATEFLIKGLKKQFDIDSNKIIGHYQVSKKTCPNIDVDLFKQNIGI